MRASEWSVRLGLAVAVGAILASSATSLHRAWQQTARIDQAVINAQSDRRLLLFGSSNIQLGLSAEIFQQALGVRAFNVAQFHAGAHLDALLQQQARKFFGHNDVVVFSDRDWRSTNPRPDRPSLVANISSMLALPGIKLAPYLRGAVAPEFERISSFGDAKYPIQPDPPRPAYHKSPIHFDDRALRGLRQKMELIRSTGACPIAVYTPLLIDARDRGIYNVAQQQLNAKVRAAHLDTVVLDLPMLLDDPRLFYDHSHLNARGRKLWTDAIVQLIQSNNSCGLGSKAPA